MPSEFVSTGRGVCSWDLKKKKPVCQMLRCDRACVYMRWILFSSVFPGSCLKSEAWFHRHFLWIRFLPLLLFLGTLNPNPYTLKPKPETVHTASCEGLSLKGFSPDPFVGVPGVSLFVAFDP